MVISLVATLASVFAGVLMTLVGAARPTVLLPLRSFAMAALLASVLLHLLPDAIAGAGGATLLAFVAGLVLPNLFSALRAWRSPTPRRHAHDHLPALGHRNLVLLFGISGVLLHQMGDGLALGAFSSGPHAGHVHWDLVIGIAAHTVPLVAIVTLPIQKRRNMAVIALAMFAASALGITLAQLGGLGFAASVLPWLNAAVAGLLLHILAHDTPTVTRTHALRLTETIAVVVGFALPVVLSHGDHESATPGAQLAPEFIDVLRNQLLDIAPMLLLGVVGAVIIIRWAPHTSVRRLATGSALRDAFAGARLALTVPRCSCGVLATATSLHTRGAAGAAVVAYLFIVPELGLDTISLTAHIFGWPIAVLRLAVAAAAALLAGYVIGRRWPVKQTPLSEPPVVKPTWRNAIEEVTIHSVPWLAAGAVCAAFVALALDGKPVYFAAQPELQIAAIVAIAIPSYICAAAATPLAGTLVAHGLTPGAALAGLLIGAMANIASLRFLRDRLERNAILLALAPPAIIVGAAAMYVSYSELGNAATSHSITTYINQAAPTWLNYTALTALALLILHSLWRFGFSAWLEPIVGNEHAHHHQHGADEACSDGCHHDDDEHDNEPDDSPPPGPLVSTGGGHHGHHHDHDHHGHTH
ncbi:MAG: permease [Kofleriaceae bacterium]|nr:permease [Kofleriaceae bacterium]